MTSLPVVRFAPSPTGRIHIGNARTALLNWLLVSPSGGTFILRFDDTDVERSRAEYAEAIEADLAWLGIKPDLTRRQSERIAAYDEAVARLKTLGRLYPAYETAEELDRRRKRQQALGRPRYTIGPPFACQKRSGLRSKRRAVRRIGVSVSNLRRFAGTTWCAAKVTSIARRCPIRCCAARTGPTFTR
jgi:glutamyl/glutaminyl-tRNA synthetase